MEREQIATEISSISNNLLDLSVNILEGISRNDFLEGIVQTIRRLEEVRKEAIRHTRALKTGVKKDGTPDKRFSRNRKMPLKR